MICSLSRRTANEESSRTSLVVHSSLHFKESLVKNLVQFVTDAKSAGRDLQKFSSRVGGAVDEIVALNEHVLHLLERTANEIRPQIGNGFVQQVYNALLPVAPAQPQAIAVRRKEIKSLWYQMTAVMKENIEKLILEARLNMGALDRLEAQLGVINGILAREDNKINADELELVSASEFRTNRPVSDGIIPISWTNCGRGLGETRVGAPGFAHTETNRQLYRKAAPSQITWASLDRSSKI